MTRGYTFPVYVVETGPHHQEGLLHSLTAEHLLTFDPQPGDAIFAQGAAHCGFSPGNRIVVSVVEIWARGDERGFPPRVILSSHAGRSPSPGEDGLEDAYGHDVLGQALAEKLYVLLGQAWRVATGEATAEEIRGAELSPYRGDSLAIRRGGLQGWLYQPVAVEVPEGDTDEAYLASRRALRERRNGPYLLRRDTEHERQMADGYAAEMVDLICVPWDPSARERRFPEQERHDAARADRRV